MDYYFRPYFIATENLLHNFTRWENIYCSGPEISFLRVLDLAYDFVKSFQNRSYFGLFWTISVSHNSISGASSMDYSFKTKLIELEKIGVLETSMVVLMSDHGLRFGEFRESKLGWYEDRLPLLYIWLPEWFRNQSPEAHQALINNQNKLISTFDLYETLRDILIRGGGYAPPSSGCPNCTSLFTPVPDVRGCDDAGIDNHWCACAKFEDVDVADEKIVKGANTFLKYVENIIKNYKKNDKRLCAKLELKKINNVKQFKTNDKSNKLEFSYSIETSPGGAKFEFTAHYDGIGKYIIHEEHVSRIDSYYKGSMCLEKGYKKYCECI